MAEPSATNQRLGTATIMFTDLVASTQLRESLGEDAADAFSIRHERLLARLVTEHRGRVVKEAGDGIMAAFDAASDAVGAAVAIQREIAAPSDLHLANLDLRVRIGLAAGDVTVTPDDCKGMPVVEAARLEAAAEAGQILCTELVRQLTRNRRGHRFEPVGSMELKGIREPVEVSAVIWSTTATSADTGNGAHRDVIATRSHPGNLATEVSSFLGRETELLDVIELVTTQRVVTLTGPGGVGKTRLALRAAADAADQFPDGVWVVELAALTDPEALPAVIGSVLGMASVGEESITDHIMKQLANRRLLLVLDNCEHLVASVARLVERVLTASSAVTVLATSREALQITAEHQWPVPPLDIASGVSSSAIKLFLARVRSVDPAFELSDPAQTNAAIEICQRLDGIPLAIELAAARMMSLSAEEIRDRLDSRFRLLTGSGRGLERHQTLRHVVQWSYDLLDDREQAVASRCSFFSDGFDLQAANAVAGERLGLDEYAVLDVLDSLVRKSLLNADRSTRRTRYTMLETTREFLQHEPDVSPTADIVRDDLARHFAASAVKYWQVWNSPQQRDAIDWVDTEFANLREAHRWATLRGDIETAVSIASHTTMLAWPLQLYESVGWCEENLAAAEAANVAMLPRLYTAASLCVYLRRPEEAVDYAQTALALGNDPAYDPFLIGPTEITEATAQLLFRGAEPWLETCRRLASEPGFAGILGRAGLAWMLPLEGRLDEARTMAEETLAMAIDYGNPMGIAFAYAGFGRSVAGPDPQRALTVLRSGLMYSREQRLDFWESLLTREVAALEAVHGDVGQALHMFDTSIAVYHRAGNVTNAVFTIAYLAVLFDRIGQPEIASTLYGATTGHVDVNWITGLSVTVEDVRDRLGDVAFEASVADGAAMEFNQAVQFARTQIQLASGRGNSAGR